jgi:DNA mismatch endonuclease (patch repair protein)
MSRQQTKDTRPEIEIRRELHRRGLRFRVGRQPVPGLRTKADIVFSTARVAIYVDGCFWHSCPEHATQPAANAAWWKEKLRRNRDRDIATNQALEDAGWTVVRVWEHEAPESAADRIEDVVRARRADGATPPLGQYR